MDGSSSDIRQRIEDWFKVHSDKMVEDLGRLVSVRSVKGPQGEGEPYGPGSREALRLAGSILEEQGFSVSEFEDMVITSDFGAQPMEMGILAHLDVVDAGEGWDTDPYKLHVKEGIMLGRGVVDNKGPAVAAIYAMRCARDLLRQPARGFRLILGSGEESGCDDIENYLGKNAPPRHVFTPDAEYPVVNTEKGRAAVFFGASWDKETTLPRVVSIDGGKTMNVVPNRAEAVVEGFTVKEVEMFCMVSAARTGTKITVHAGERGEVITVEGRSAHAASPENGVNAQTALLDMLANMPLAPGRGFDHICALNRLFPHGEHSGKALGIAMGDDITGALTVNFGVLRFTETDFAANLDSRTPACADEVDLLGMFRSAFEKEGVALTNSRMTKCHHTPEDSPFIKTLLRIYNDYMGEPGHCLAVGGQTYVHGVPGGVAFGIERSGADNNIHGANEFLSIEQFTLDARMFAQAIIDICG